MRDLEAAFFKANSAKFNDKHLSKRPLYVVLNTHNLDK